jgi:hypothetical protein
MLRLADEQTVVAIGAALQAIDRHGLTGTDFTNWGILGTPTFLGRSTIVNAILRFHTEGAWGVSPHIIPHRLLHAVSGTLSQLLGIHGPNFGVGGGPDGISEAFLTALTLINTEDLPGIWLLLSGHDPEPILDAQGQVSTPGVCVALALALGKSAAGRQRPRLRLTPGTPTTVQELASHQNLTAALNALPSVPSVHWRIGGFGSLSLQGEAA